MNNRIKITEKPALTIFLKRRLWRVKSKALVMSMAQLNTSEPFFMYQSTVYSTAHVHIVAEQPAW